MPAVSGDTTQPKPGGMQAAAGDQFDNIQDHSDYLNKGGCSKLIDQLAAERALT